MNTINILEQFLNNDDACTEYLCNLRWATDPICPYCNSQNTHIKPLETNRRRRLQCRDCLVSFSPTVNTIMHQTRIPLWKWFYGISLLSEAKKSISSRQLARHLGLPVKTAYSLSQRIRKGLLGTRSPILQGIIEMDETYIGGKPRHSQNGVKVQHKRGRGTSKTMVAGMVERKGKVIAYPVAKGTYNTRSVRDMVLENVDVAESEIYTDEFRVYNTLSRIIDHKQINHSAREYVRGMVHTNSIEGFWSLVKRAWYGTHHNYSVAYMELYINEAAFKYNTRHNTASERFNSMLSAVSSDV